MDSGTDFVVIGAIVGAFGVTGEFKVKPLIDDTSVFRKLKQADLFLRESKTETVAVTSKRFHKGFWLLKVDGIDTPEAAIALKGVTIKVPRAALPKPADDEVYWMDIKGYPVEDQAGEHVGILADYMETGSHDVFQIDNDEKRLSYLISNNPNHVIKIDTESKKVIINREGLVEN